MLLRDPESCFGTHGIFMDFALFLHGGFPLDAGQFLRSGIRRKITHRTIVRTCRFHGIGRQYRCGGIRQDLADRAAIQIKIFPDDTQIAVFQYQ